MNRKRFLTQGEIYNIGVGPNNTLSLLSLFDWFKETKDIQVKYDFSNWRTGDQPVYFSNIDKISSDLNWSPTIGTTEGLEKLYQWINDNLKTINRILSSSIILANNDYCNN